MTTIKREEKQDLKRENFYDKLYTFVMEGEWEFQPNAFCDSYYSEEEKKLYWITHAWLIRKSPQHCTYWSIWFWTKSYQGETIAYEEAIKRKVEDLQRRETYIKSDCLNDNQKIVVLDFFYQHGVNSSNMQTKVNSCRINDIYFTIVNWRDYYKSAQQWWMVKREQKRINYFYNN